MADLTQFLLPIQMGRFSKFSIMDKFGVNPDIDTGTVPQDIWDTGGEYVYDADGTAPIASIVSSDASNTQDIVIQGLNSTGTFVAQTITLNGTTPVALTTPLWRVFRMYNNSDTDIVGTVYCYVGTTNPPVDADTRAIIDGSKNQTLMALYTIPKGYVGFMTFLEAGITRNRNNGEVDLSFDVRKYGKIFRVAKQFAVTVYSSYYGLSFEAPFILPALSDIRVRVLDVSADNVASFATFTIILIDESLFTNSYLAGIEQPGY